MVSVKIKPVLLKLLLAVYTGIHFRADGSRREEFRSRGMELQQELPRHPRSPGIAPSMVSFDNKNLLHQTRLRIVGGYGALRWHLLEGRLTSASAFRHICKPGRRSKTNPKRSANTFYQTLATSSTRVTFVMKSVRNSQCNRKFDIPNSWKYQRGKNKEVGAYRTADSARVGDVGALGVERSAREERGARKLEQKNKE